MTPEQMRKSGYLRIFASYYKPHLALFLLDMLCAGELDLVLANDLAGYSFLLSERGRDFEVLGDPLPLDSFPSLVSIGVRKGDEDLREEVNRAIRTIRFSGAFGRINRNYFPYILY